MRSEFLALTLVALAGCGAKSTAVCAPVASWSLPAVACAAPVVAVVEPEPEPPAPEPEPEPPPPPVEVIADTIELRDTVQFETGEAVLLAASEQLLDEVAKILADHPELLEVSIEGHTDDVGSESSNKKLSKKRAAAVRTYLIGKGIDKKRLVTDGFGEAQPVADNTSDDGRFKNRRVEFKITKRQ